MRVSCGVPGLDNLLSGGLPENSVVLVFGPPGSGKSTFTLEFMAQGLKNNEKCVLVTTTEAPDTLMKKFDLFAVTPKQLQNLIIIDCYSWRINKPVTKYGVKSLDLTALSIEVRKALAENTISKGRFALDSLSDFLLFVEEKNVFLFLQMLVGEIKKTQSVGFINLEEGPHTDKQYSTINYITDGMINLTVKDNNRVLRVARMVQTEHSLDWVKFEIARGTELAIQEFFR